MAPADSWRQLSRCLNGANLSRDETCSFDPRSRGAGCSDFSHLVGCGEAARTVFHLSCRIATLNCDKMSFFPEEHFCSPDETKCGQGYCIPTKNVCDGTPQCIGALDEKCGAYEFCSVRSNVVLRCFSDVPILHNCRLGCEGRKVSHVQSQFSGPVSFTMTFGLNKSFSATSVAITPMLRCSTAELDQTSCCRIRGRQQDVQRTVPLPPVQVVCSAGSCV